MSYQDQVKERLGKILLVLLDMLTSKKFLAALAGAVTAYQTTGDPMVFLYAALTYVLAQGVADHGKPPAANGPPPTIVYTSSVEGLSR